MNHTAVHHHHGSSNTSHSRQHHAVGHYCRRDTAVRLPDGESSGGCYQRRNAPLVTSSGGRWHVSSKRAPYALHHECCEGSEPDCWAPKHAESLVTGLDETASRRLVSDLFEALPELDKAELPSLEVPDGRRPAGPLTARAAWDHPVAQDACLASGVPAMAPLLPLASPPGCAALLRKRGPGARLRVAYAGS